MSTTAIVQHRAPFEPRDLTLADMELFKMVAQAAALAVVAGAFKGKREDAIMALIGGHALGLHPGITLNKAYVVNGRVGWPADVLLGVCISREPLLRYEFIEETDERCVIEGWLEGRPKYRAFFSQDDARKSTYFDRDTNSTKTLMDKDNWRNYTRDMLASKAVLRMIRRVAPHAAAGLPAAFDESHGEPIPESDTVIRDEPSGAEEIVGAVTKDETPEAAAPSPAPVPPDQLPAKFIMRARACGWNTKEDLLRAANLMLEREGLPKVSSAISMSVTDWQAAWKWIDILYDENGKPRPTREALGKAVDAAGDTVDTILDENPDADAEESPATTAPVSEFEEAFTIGDVTTFVAYCRKKERDLGRRFLDQGQYRGTGAPPLFFCDAPILEACGFVNTKGAVAQKLLGGSKNVPSASPAVIQALAKEIARIGGKA